MQSRYCCATTWYVIDLSVRSRCFWSCFSWLVLTLGHSKSTGAKTHLGAIRLKGSISVSFRCWKTYVCAYCWMSGLGFADWCIKPVSFYEVIWTSAGIEFQQTDRSRLRLEAETASAQQTSVVVARKLEAFRTGSAAKKCSQAPGTSWLMDRPKRLLSSIALNFLSEPLFI